MEKYVITCQLPKAENSKPVLIDGQPVYEENYFCGFQPVPNPNFRHIQLIEWDTDRQFAKFFLSKYEAKQTLKLILTESNCVIKKVYL